MTTTHMKLTEQERTTIVNALTVAARHYEIDSERASELALHGMTIFEPAHEIDRLVHATRPKPLTPGTSMATRAGARRRHRPETRRGNKLALRLPESSSTFTRQRIKLCLTC
jgi:hypothetical protein